MLNREEKLMYGLFGLLIAGGLAFGSGQGQFAPQWPPEPTPAAVVTPAPTPIPTPTPVPTPEVITEPGRTAGTAELPLVNPWHPLCEDYTVELVRGPDMHLVSSVCYADLTAMYADCQAAGLNPLVCSGHRTHQFQVDLFENKVGRVMAQGYGRQEAEVIAARSVARPDTSEHQTGLAVDIIDADYKVLDETQELRPTQAWLLENSWKYGFTLRFPTGKSDWTGVIYEPWHYRYVGREVARQLHESGQCLEEYLWIYH